MKVYIHVNTERRKTHAKQAFLKLQSIRFNRGRVLKLYRTLLSIHTTVCSFVDGYQRFGRIYCLLLQGKRLSAENNFYRYMLGRPVTMFACCLQEIMRQIFSKQINIRFQETVLVTVAAGSTSMGRHLSSFFCTKQGRSKPLRDVSTYLPKTTYIASQKSLALTLTGLRASVFIYYLSLWRQIYTISVLKMLAAGFFETSVTLPLYMASHPTEPSRNST